MTKFINANSVNIWRSVLEEINIFVKTDIYYEINYIKNFLKKDSIIKGFIYKEDNKSFFLPIIISKIPNEKKIYDFETVYGYSGPLVNNDSISFINKALEKFFVELKKNRIIAGLIRFHPFISNHKHIIENEKIKILLAKKIVYMDRRIDDINLSKNAVRNIKKSIKHDIKFDSKSTKSNIKHFYTLYNSLMKKKLAEEMYNFDEEYFLNIFRNNKDKIFIKLAIIENKVLGGIIFSVYNNYLNILLSATSDEGLKIGVAYSLRNEVINSYNNKIINFGGGISNRDDDALFVYKKNFSKKTKNFYIGKIITDEKIYYSLIKNWDMDKFDSPYKNYHLKYRY